MARGIFVNRNGTWVPVNTPAVNKDGAWSNVKAGFVNRDGVWSQFYPGNLLAKLLVIAGGAGGGIGYGSEGGGGGGAGGVVYKENIPLSLTTGSAYSIVVGAGGAAAGLSLTRNSLGSRGYTYQDFATEYGHSLADVLAVANAYTSAGPLGQFFPTYNSKGRAGSWGGFINSYGVWTEADGYNPANSATVTTYFFVNLPYSGRYTVEMAADNWMQFTINGQAVAAMEGFGGSNRYDFTASAGPALITINARNYSAPSGGNPAGFAAVIFDTSGGVVWSTQPGAKTFYGLNRKPETGGLNYWIPLFINTYGRNVTRLYEAMFNSVIAQGSTSADFKNGAFGPSAGIPFNSGSYSGNISDKPDISLGFSFGGGIAGNGNNSSALGFTAIGGGSGGWGISDATAGSGGSGGGGCGNALTRPGGQGLAGQGNPGGTGQVRSGGAGGGGSAGAGSPSNGTTGGVGGSGVQLLGFSVGGGGGGGGALGGRSGSAGGGGGGPGGGGGQTYTNSQIAKAIAESVAQGFTVQQSIQGAIQNYGVSLAQAQAAAALYASGNYNSSISIGSIGSGQPGEPGTGGGGGGSASGGESLGGTGGSGAVVIRYSGSRALFTGGAVTVGNGEVTHVFTSTGTLAAI